MQKKLLTLAIMASLLPSYGQAAQDEPITAVDGTILKYTSSVYWIRDGATYHDEGIIASICTAADGNEVYIRDLMPAWEEGWLKGTIADGELHFPSGQLVSQWGVGDIYMDAAVKDRRTGNLNTVDEFVLIAGSEGSYRLADRNGETVYIRAYLHDGTILETDYGLILTPFNSIEAEPPAEAETAEYTRTYFDSVSKYPYSDTVTIATLGNDLWLEGFNGSSKGFVAGTMLENGDIFIPSGQYAGQSGSYANYMFSAETDPVSGVTTDTPGLTLHKQDEGWSSGQNAMLMFGFNKDQIEFRQYNFWLAPVDTSGITTAAPDMEIIRTEYYDLTGRKLNSPASGVSIVVREYSDGTRTCSKELIR